MEIEKLQIIRMHVPNTDCADDYVAIKINNQVFRTEDIELVRRECLTFLKGASVMPEEKTIKVECLMCNVGVDIPLSDMRIISEDQGSGFIQNPQYVCEKCGGVCTVTLPEPTG